MVIQQRTFPFKGWEARIVWGDSSFGQVEPTDAGGWQVRFFRGVSDLGPYQVASLEQGWRYLKAFGMKHQRRLAFTATKDLRMRDQLHFVPLLNEPVISLKKKRATSLPKG